jgi:probable phosphoglycerate mutase
MKRLYLVRHGVNDLVGKRLAGRAPGVHLNEQGQQQAQALVSILKETRIDAIYTSPLDRAIETAAPLAADRGRSAVVREGLNEIQYGTWEGKSLAVLQKRKLWPIVQHSPSLARFPKGESFLEAQNRIVDELENIRQGHRGDSGVVCVFHSDPIKLGIAHYLGLSIDLFQRLSIAPASISVLAIHDHGVRLLTLNDTRATNL